MPDSRSPRRDFPPALLAILRNADLPASPSRDSLTPGELALGAVIGRASEYFDFFVFAIASVVVIPQVFFPFAPPLLAALYAFAIFALAFIARPLGTIAFMAVQRHFGRAAKLISALMLLGVSTVGMAFLPSFHDQAMTAVVLLALLRIGQGLALGGSWDGLSSLLALNAPENRRGWYTMLGQLGAPLGFVMAAGLFAFLLSNLSPVDFLDWGWRFPFFVAFAINVVALFARLSLVSTNEFEQLLDERELVVTGIGELLRTQKLNLVLGALAALASCALFHLVTVFPLSWISLTSSRSLVEILVVQIIGAGLCGLGIIASGLIADRVGRRNTVAILAGLIAAFSWLVPILMNGGETGQNIFILLGFGLLGLSYGQAAEAVTASFPAQYRYTGAALTSDLAWLVGAGFAPLVALGLSVHFGLAYVSLYLLSGAVWSLVAVLLSRALESRV